MRSVSPRPPTREPGLVARLAAFVLLLGGGLTLLLFAMRLVGAALGRGFSPFGYLGLPGSYAWQALLFVMLVAASFVLLVLLVGPARDALWLAGAGGGVLIPAKAIEGMLVAEAREHPEVVRAEADVRIRRGRPSARLEIDLRPLADADALAGALEARVREALSRVTGIADVDVRLRTRVLTVRQLPGRLS